MKVQYRNKVDGKDPRDCYADSAVSMQLLRNAIQFVKEPEHKVTVKKPKEFFDDST